MREINNRFVGDKWFISCDFNVVKKDGERNGTNVCINMLELNDFNEFIDYCDLIDVLAFGNKFTWFNNEGSSMSRLDRSYFRII